MEPEPSKSRATGKTSKSKSKKAAVTPEAEEDGEPDSVRCICGATEEDDDVDISWVACDTCGVWQHTDCMGLSGTDYEDRPYFCEQCRPQNHKSLLAAIKRGERPWEPATQRREEQKQKKKGKRGRKSRASEVKPHVGNDNVPSPQKVGPAEETALGNSQKRKHGDEGSVIANVPEVIVNHFKNPGLNLLIGDQEPQSKVRKVSSPTVEKASETYGTRRKSAAASGPKGRESKGVNLQTELVEKIVDLQNPGRQKVADALVKACTMHTYAAQKQGTFTLPPGQDPDAFNLKLGLNVEFALYMNYWSKDNQPTDNYRQQYSRITSNLKANSSLRDRLLNGSLSPNELAKMSSADMASEEQKEKEERMRKETEKQHVLIQDEGPRIRRTHKGEEIVGDVSNSAGVGDSVFSSAPVRRRDSEIDPEKKGETPAQTPVTPNVPQLPTEGTTKSPPSVSQKQPLTVDTKAPIASPPATGRPGSAAFDMDNVWSSVGGQRSGARAPPQTATAENQDTGPRTQHDAEIDRMLNDDEAEDEPYSPTDNAPDSDAPVWQGILAMDGVAELQAIGKFVAGANLSSKYPWRQLMPPKLVVKGRIPVDTATQYLCNLRYSSTCDVSVVAITADQNSISQIEMEKLCTHLTERHRFGVLASPSVSEAKDMYLVPIQPGSGSKPEFIELLADCALPDNIPERMLLAVYVFRNAGPPTNGQQQADGQAAPNNHVAGPPIPVASTPVGPQASPYPAAGQQQQQQHPAIPTHSSTPSQQHQAPPYNYPGAPYQQQPPQGYQPPPYHQQQQQQPVGIDAARQVLGPDQAGCKSVQQLLGLAPQTSLKEFEIIKEMFERVPATKDDYEMLVGILASSASRGT